MTLTFWFDIHSPWCYLASTRIQAVAKKHDCRLEWRPLHLPQLIKAIDGRRPLEENAAFVRWYKQDLIDWAEQCGVKIAYHPHYPLRNSRALRVCLHAADRELADRFVPRLFKAYWSEAADITDLDNLARLAEESGLSGEDARDAAVSETMKVRLRSNLEEAVGRGIFGVPTVDTGKKLYFGNDRLEMLDLHLETT